MGELNSGRVALVLLTLYALVMITPDFLRVVRPLGSFGLASSGDGVIYEIRGPFAAEEDSPAWRAGLRRGDRLDFAAMHCIPVDTEVCASVMALWAGVNYVVPGREATVFLAATGERPARKVTLVAPPRPTNRLLDVVLMLDQVAGVLVVLGAAWLVWTRPGPMTWGFFTYVMLFNPGQSFQFYAWLQQWPRALLVQDVASCVLQAAGFAGLLLFSLRAPVDRVEGKWRRVEQALPGLAILFLLVELASLGSLFGYPVEIWIQGSVLVGFLVSVATVGILLGRRRDLSPRDYQRIRWVIWGALIGLPAYLLAQLSQETSLLTGVLGEGVAPEELADVLYLINGVLCLFVVEAVRRQTVVNVWIPLRRATALGLVLSVPVLFLHKQMETIDEYLHMPEWAWVLVASGLIYLIARAHEFATELIERLFNRRFILAERDLAIVGETIQQGKSLAEIERLLVNEPLGSLGLASAALFREQDGVFQRRASVGWDADDADTLTGEEPFLAARLQGRPYALNSVDIRASHVRLPGDLARPVLVAPVGNSRRCYAIVFYGGHEAGTDLDVNERRVLGGLAHDAEIAYAEIEREMLHKRIKLLESGLARAPEHR